MVLDVRNTSEIIDGVTTRIIGVPAAEVVSRPALLPLFPDASGQVTMSVGLPASYPAGRHPVTVEVASAGAGQPSAYLDLDLLVAARPELSLSCRPQLIRARRQARFAVHLSNSGNVPLDVELAAVDADRAVSTTFQPARLRVEADSALTCLLTVRGPRMITGAELDRTLTVRATARAGRPGGRWTGRPCTTPAGTRTRNGWTSCGRPAGTAPTPVGTAPARARPSRR